MPVLGRWVGAEDMAGRLFGLRGAGGGEDDGAGAGEAASAAGACRVQCRFRYGHDCCKYRCRTSLDYVTRQRKDWPTLFCKREMNYIETRFTDVYEHKLLPFPLLSKIRPKNLSLLSSSISAATPLSLQQSTDPRRATRRTHERPPVTHDTESDGGQILGHQRLDRRACRV